MDTACLEVLAESAVRNRPVSQNFHLWHRVLEDKPCRRLYFSPRGELTCLLANGQVLQVDVTLTRDVELFLDEEPHLVAVDRTTGAMGVLWATTGDAPSEGCSERDLHGTDDPATTRDLELIGDSTTEDIVAGSDELVGNGDPDESGTGEQIMNPDLDMNGDAETNHDLDAASYDPTLLGGPETLGSNKVAATGGVSWQITRVSEHQVPQSHPVPSCPGCPVAMAFTAGGDLVLCTRQPNTLLRYPAAGSLPPTWSRRLANEPQYLTTDTTDRVITTDGRHVRIYDGRGKELACLGGGGGGSGSYLRQPAGVCTDSHDNILVADYDSRHIVCYSRTGELRRLVAQVPDRPGDIAVLGTSHLAVATEKKGVLIYDYSKTQLSSDA